MKPGIKTSEGWTTWVFVGCTLFTSVMATRDLDAANPVWGHAVTVAAMIVTFFAARGYTKDRAKLKIAEALNVDVATVDAAVKARLSE